MTGTFPLAGHAAQHWLHHAHSDADGHSETLHRLTMLLLNPEDVIYHNWLSIHDPDEGRHLPQGGPLYYTSLAGLNRASLAVLAMEPTLTHLEVFMGMPCRLRRQEVTMG